MQEKDRRREKRMMIYLKETLTEALESQKANRVEVSEADVTEVRRENKPYDIWQMINECES